MKKVFLCLAVFAMSFSAIGQEKQEKVLRHKGFETNRFVDNWEISVLGGAQAWHTDQGNRLQEPLNLFKIGGEITPAVQVAVGKWASPVFGARVAFQGFNLNPKEEGLEKIPYTYLHTDVMVNATNWICGYKSDRLYNAVIIGGFGWAAANVGTGWDDEFAATVGLSNRFRLCDALSIHLDLSGFLTKEAFGLISTDGGVFGTNYELMAGLSYKLPTERNFYVVDYSPYKKKISSLEQDLAASRKDLEQGQEDNSDLKNQLAKERKAKEDALAEAKRLRESLVPSTTQSLSIYFTIGSSKITDKNMENIKFLAEAIKASAKDRVFTITGYADEQTGSAEYNMQLSKRRAEAVYNALLEQGVEAKKLKVEYKGDTEQPFKGRPYMNRVAVVK